MPLTIEINARKIARFAGFKGFSLFSLIYEITCLSHSTAEISAAENRKKPKILRENKPLYLKVYLTALYREIYSCFN